MAGRRTNLALLWATVLAVATGVGAFIVGTPAGSWVVVAHGVVALAIVVLVPWKSSIVRRGLSKNRSGRLISIVLTVFVLGVLITGLLLVSGESFAIGPFTTMQLHVGFGLTAVALTLVHTWQRPTSFRTVDLERRNVLRTGGLVAASAGLWLLVEGALDLVPWRGGQRRFTGSHEIVDPGDIPATQWINDRVQHLDASRHVVSFPGRDIPVTDLDGTDQVEATLDCTGGWFSTQVWSGTRLDRLIDDASGVSIVVRSTTGYWRRFPVEQASELLLATQVAGSPLSDGNGAPVRLVAPNRRGYWWVKWVDRVEVDDLPAWWQPPLPTA